VSEESGNEAAKVSLEYLKKADCGLLNPCKKGLLGYFGGRKRHYLSFLARNSAFLPKLLIFDLA
jgi:hypothetical protein